MLDSKLIQVQGRRVLHLTNDAGRPFRVRLVMPGEVYGRTNALTNEGKTLVEFYDATYAGADDYGPLGQYVTRYNLDMLDGTSEWATEPIGETAGLDLQGGVPAWKLDAESARVALAYAQDHSPTDGVPVFTHNCDACTYLGHYLAHDLYSCDGGVIARRSSEGSDYLSMHIEPGDTVPAVLAEAARRAAL